MADHAVEGNDIGAHETLVMNLPDKVTFEHALEEVEVLNRSGGDAIYFTVDGTEPTIGGSNCYVLPAAMGSLKVPVQIHSSGAEVRLISASAESYSVTRA